MSRPFCGWCGHDEPRDLLIVMSRDRPDRPPRYSCRASVDVRCLSQVSPGGRAADAIALLIAPTPDDLAALRAATKPGSRP